MKYSKNLVKEITTELEKVPLIRHVCTKVGIDHSTFYRWMIRHPTFLKLVQGSLYLGRKKLNDVAESVIINGIQNKEFKSSAFWLVHNDPRYMSHAKGQHYQLLNDHMIHIFQSDLSEEYADYPTTFEKMFNLLYETEEILGEDRAKKMLEPFLTLACHEDLNLIDIFHATYAEWRNNLVEVKSKVKKAGLEDVEEKSET